MTKQNMGRKIRNSSWIIAPVLCAMTGLLFNYLNWIDLCDNNLRSSLLTSSGLLAGFLFTSFSLIIALPSDNAAIRAFKKNDYIDCLVRNISIGIAINVAVLVVAITKLPAIYVVVLFFMGLGNIAVAGYFIFYIFSSISIISRDKI